jgi:APA family basic amino acid/polyamine antiporter
MCAWIVGGLYSLIGAWSLSEVSAMIPSAGGYYAVARRAFGDYLSFVVGWTDCVSLCAAMATITILAGEYFGDLVPRFANHNVSVAMSVVLILTLIQVRGIRWGSRFQDVTTAITAFVFFSIIIVAFLLPHHTLQSASAVLPMPTGLALFPLDLGPSGGHRDLRWVVRGALLRRRDYQSGS